MNERWPKIKTTTAAHHTVNSEISKWTLSAFVRNAFGTKECNKKHRKRKRKTEKKIKLYQKLSTTRKKFTRLSEKIAERIKTSENTI